MKGLFFTLAQKLIDNNLTISGAESCTGGMVVSELVGFPGISAVLNESYVTYSNEAKIRVLGVDPQTLETFGAVSGECVREMVKGLKEKTGSDICFSVSGIAGPDGGTEEKPVGTVFLAIMIKGEIFVWKEFFSGDRDDIRKKSSSSVITKIIDNI